MSVGINIIFHAKSDTPDLVFVEVENDNGESIGIGQWDEIPESNLRKLRIEMPTNATMIEEVLITIDQIGEKNNVKLCVAEFYDFNDTKELIRRLGFIDTNGHFHYTQARELNGNMSGGMSRNIPARWLERVMPLGLVVRQMLS